MHMKSGIGIWNKVCLSIVCVGLALCAPGLHLLAQDDFREFDRKLVVTPAELYEALSNFQPATEQTQVDSQRRKEFEKVQRDLLSQFSQLPPEKQDKLWEFVEKFVRKNGVDSAPTKNLMQKFGIPPERLNELSKQLQKFSRDRSDDVAPGGSGGDQDRDVIRQLMRKALEESRQADRLRKVNLPNGVEAQNGNGAEALPSNRPYPASTSEGSANDRRRSNGETDQSRSTKLPTDQRATGQPDSNAENRNRNRSDSNSGQRSDPRSERRSKSGNRSKPMMPRNRQRGNTTNSEAELEKLMKQLRENAKEVQRKSGRDSAKKGLDAINDLDLTKVIEELAQKDGDGTGFDLKRALNNPRSTNQNLASENNGASKDQASKSLLDRAKGWASGTLDPEKKSKGESSSGRNGNASNEKVGTRFDRLLVKAVDRTLDRTLESQNEQGVSKGVGGVLGKLIERFKDQESKEQGGQPRETGRGESSRRSGGRRSRDSGKAEADRIARNESGGSNGSSNSGSSNRGGSATNPQTPEAETNFNPRSMLDSIPDLSSINPTHVFMFFAIAGFILFVGYLMTQSLAPSEVAAKKRSVIKRVRNTTIKTPKDLVETVDMFLLAKFGIKSSWWNAKLAQRVLDSGSPELQSQVDDLFRDYVRARYMRNDVQIPDVDQRRFKQTLEELSKLDIKPDLNLGFVPVKANSAVSLEG